MKLATPRLAGVALLVALSTAGCSKKETAVSGVVRYNGQPLPTGSVILYCENKQIVHGLIGPGGEYTIPNVPKGLVKVTVRVHGQVPQGFARAVALPPVTGGPVDPGTARQKAERLPMIPVRYGTPEESDLSFQVDGPNMTFDINLHS
jgi:hypothetical protein